MAVKSKDELLASINSIEGLDEDVSISLIEDISDTMDSFSSQIDWKTKYEENDASWKKKYKERFFSSPASNNDDDLDDDDDKPKTYTFEALFKTN